MKKLLPYIFGIGLGILVAQFSWQVALGVFFLCQIPFTGYLVLSGLKDPTVLDFCPDRSVQTDYDRHLKTFRNLGFLASQNMDIDGATITVLVHPEETITASVFQTNTAPAKVSFGIESERAGGGKLTTGTTAGVIPITADSFAQGFPKATPAAALKEHQKALEYLKSKGVEFKPPYTSVPTLKDVREDFCLSHAKSRALFKSRFLYHSAISFFRAVGGPNPHKKSIQEQPKVAAQFEN